MLVIGLTGGIGSGKSTVSNYFNQHGIPIIDADIIARELTATQKPAWEKISAHFGPGILRTDQSLDREKLRELVFNHSEARTWLENLLHPLITQEIQRQLNNLDSPYCIVVIPLLVETGPYSFLDRILVVDTPEKIQLERLQNRDQASIEALKKIIAIQSEREARLSQAHDLIQNQGSQAELSAQVDKLHALYLSLAHGSHEE